jgi:hypothetical protein
MSFDEIQWNSNPCEAISYGEVEDYTVNIVAGAADTTACSIKLSCFWNDYLNYKFIMERIFR